MAWRRSAFGIGDQIFLSVLNMTLIFGAAPLLSVVEFGHFLVLYSLLSASLVLVRRTTGVIIGLDPNPAEGFRSSFALSAILVALLALVCITYTFAASEISYKATAFFVAAMALLACRECARLFLLRVSDGIEQLVLSGLLAFLALLAFAGTKLLPWFSLPYFLSSWILLVGVGATLSTLKAFAASDNESSSSFWSWWRSSKRAIGNLGAEALATAFTPTFVAIAVEAFLGASVVAVYRGAKTLFMPVNLLFSSIPVVALPALANSNPRVWTRVTRTMGVAAAVFAAVWAVFLGALPVGLGYSLLGPTWSGVGGVFAIVGVEYALTGACLGLVTLARLRRNFGWIALSKYLSIVVSFLSLTLVVLLDGGATGVCVALALGVGAQLLLMACIPPRSRATSSNF